MGMSRDVRLLPLSLRFADPALEREYCVLQFRQSKWQVILICGVNACSHVLAAIALPEFKELLLPGFLIFVSLFVLRMLLLRKADQGGAHMIFYYGLGERPSRRPARPNAHRHHLDSHDAHRPPRRTQSSSSLSARPLSC